MRKARRPPPSTAGTNRDDRHRPKDDHSPRLRNEAHRRKDGRSRNSRNMRNMRRPRGRRPCPGDRRPRSGHVREPLGEDDGKPRRNRCGPRMVSGCGPAVDRDLAGDPHAQSRGSGLAAARAAKDVPDVGFGAGEVGAVRACFAVAPESGRHLLGHLGVQKLEEGGRPRLAGAGRDARPPRQHPRAREGFIAFHLLYIRP